MTKHLIEKGTNYSYLLNAQTNPSFENIRKLSVKFVMQLPEEVKTFLWEELENGVQVLESEGQLSMYMHAYGKMHLAKLLAAFDHLPMQIVDDINLVDWGCGQGTATIAYFDYLNEKGLTQNVKSITLIEPSELAIKRAALHAHKLFPNAKIHTINKRFNEINTNEIPFGQHEIILHFFSNILDVEEFEIEDIYTKINCEKNTNYMVCVGPLLNDRRNQRMTDFVNYFSNSNLLSEYENNEWHCGWKINYKVLEICTDDTQEFEELFAETVTDIDGNVYKTVKIGSQIWMAENLRVSRYRNGDLILNLNSRSKWEKTVWIGACCDIYINNYEYDFGKLYNWIAINDQKVLAPEGWHIPNVEEYKELVDYLGFNGATKLKEVGEEHWFYNENATNECGFTALPAGLIDEYGFFEYFGERCFFWASNQLDKINAYCIEITDNNHVSYLTEYKQFGFSVRCIKDEPDDSFEIVWENGFCGFRNKYSETKITKYLYEDAIAFKDGLACVKSCGRWGLINKHGKEITISKYSDEISFCEGMAIVRLAGKYGFIDMYGFEVVIPQYEEVFAFKEGLACVKLQNKYGYIDKKGKVVISIIFDKAVSFNEGLAIVKLNNKFGFIDNQGKVKISFKYDYAYSFNEGFANVEISGKFGFIDKEGNEITKLQFDHVQSFKEGLACVELNKKSGYIDKTGKVKIDLIYYIANSFENCKAVVCNYNGEWKIIDKNGNDAFKLKREYDWIKPFKEGLAQVKFEGKFGFIDFNGNEVLPVIYDYVDYFDDCFRASLNKLDCLLDKNGNQLISFKYSFIHLLIEGVRKVGLNSKYGFIDDKYQESIPIIYDDTHTFNDGLCGVKLEDKWGYINKQNEIVIPFIYDYAGDFYCGHGKIEINNKSAFINKNGEIVTPFEDVDNSWHP